MIPDEESLWRHFLDLGDDIMRTPGLQSQARIIQERIQSFGEYEVDVWFSDFVARLPGTHELSPFPSIPTAPVLQASVESKSIAYIGKSGAIRTARPTDTTYAAAFPLMVQDVLLGAVLITRNSSETLSRKELDFFEGLLANAAVAIQINHQNVIKNWRIDQLGLVRSVGTQIASIHDIQEIADRVTSLIKDVFHYYAVSIFSREEGSEKLVFRACAGPIGEGDEPIVLEARYGIGLIGDAASSGEERLSNDVSRDALFTYHHQLPGTRSELALPLKHENKVVGVLDIQSDHVYAFHEMDLLVLRSLADQIAVAITGANLFRMITRRVNELSIVSEISFAVASKLDLDELLRTIVDLIHDRFELPFVHIYTLEQERNSITYRAGSGERSLVLNKSGQVLQIDQPKGIIPWVARNRKTRVVNQVTEDPIYQPSKLFPEATRSEITIPILFGSEALGVLDIQSNQENVFDESLHQVLEALASSVAVSIRNATLYNTERWRRQAADLMSEVASLLSANIEMPVMMDTILSALESILPCDASAIWLLEDESENINDYRRIQLAAVHGASSEELNQITRDSELAGKAFRRVLASNTPVIRTNNDPIGPLGLVKMYPPQYSSISVPLQVGENRVGILALAHQDWGRYGEESVTLTSAFASYASVAIQNARLFATAQEKAWTSTILLQIAESTQSINNMEELITTITRITPMLLGIRGCVVYLWDPVQRRYIQKEDYELNSLPCCLKIDPESTDYHPGAHSMFQTHQSMVETVPLTIHDEQSTHIIDVQRLWLPLISREQLIGLMIVDQHVSIENQRNDFLGSDRKAILQGIAQQTALAIENIQLLEQQQTETYVTAVLLQVAQLIVSQTELTDLLNSICHIPPLLVGAGLCFVSIWDDQTNEHQHYSSSDIKNSSPWFNGNEQPTDWYTDLLLAMQNSREVHFYPLVNGDTEKTFSDETSVQEWTSNPLEVPGMILIPLFVKNDYFGSMTIFDDGKKPDYRQKRLEILNGIAQQTALAIQNERLQLSLVARERLEREFQLAREIQQTFLPAELPQPEGWSLDKRWRPAREVGGDFYDVFPISKGKIAIVIADISDKGISAALYMTLTRTLLKTVMQDTTDAAEALIRLNQLLLTETPHGVFVTTFLAVLSLEDGQMKYANAGHNLPLLRSPGGSEVSLLQKGGPPLGIFENISYENKIVSLPSGSTLLLYTDGVTEATNADDFYGEKRLIDVVTQCASCCAADILEAIDSSLVEFTGNNVPSDDVAMVAIHHN